MGNKVPHLQQRVPTWAMSSLCSRSLHQKKVIKEKFRLIAREQHFWKHGLNLVFISHQAYYSKVLWTIDIRVMNEEISSYKQGCLSFLFLLWCQINAGNFCRSYECKCMSWIQWTQWTPFHSEQPAATFWGSLFWNNNYCLSPRNTYIARMPM